MADWHRFLKAMNLAVELEFDLAELYEDTVRQAQLDNLQNDTLCAAIIEWACKLSTDSWEGTPAELLTKLALTSVVGQGYVPDFPKNATALGRRLNGVEASLAQQGVRIERTRGKERKITIKLSDEFQRSASSSQNDDIDGGSDLQLI